MQWNTSYSDGKLGYFCKGSTHQARTALLEWLDTDYERVKFNESAANKREQGVIIGKRLFISHALGKGTRSGAAMVGPTDNTAVIQRPAPTEFSQAYESQQ